MTMLALVATLWACASLAYEPPGNARRFDDLERIVKADGGSKTDKAETWEKAEYPIDSGARSTILILLPKAPRTIKRFEIAASPSTADAWHDARIRLLWETDRPESAGVDLPLAALCEVPAEKSGAWTNAMPMPYKASAMLVIDSEGELSGRLTIRSVPKVEPEAGYLRGRALLPETMPIVDKGRGKVFAIGLAANERSAFAELEIAVDGTDRRAISTKVKDRPDGSPSPGLSHVSCFSEPFWYVNSFRVEPRRGVVFPPGARASLFWYSERPSSAVGSR